MSSEQEKLWSAYLDAELSASEATAFEESLTERSRQRLEAEVRLERGLGEALCADAACPAATWGRIEQMIRAQAAPTRRWNPWWTRIAAAAMLALMAGSVWAYNHYVSTPPFLQPADSVMALEDLDELGPNWAYAENYLREHGIHLTLQPLDPGALDLHGRLEFLGASHVAYRGDEVVQLLFVCCRKPIRVAVAPKDSRAAARMKAAVDGDRVRGTREVGDYVVAVVGRHRADGLMNVFAAKT
jgi:hypothetical protein